MIIDFICQALVLLLILVPICLSIAFTVLCFVFEKRHGITERDWEENFKDFDQGWY